MSAQGGVQEFGARVTQAEWVADGGPLHCTLSHDVPFYGRAVFSKRAGGSLQFTISAHQPPRSKASAILVSIPPQWKHGATRKDLGEVAILPAPTPIRLGEAEARRLLAELYDGMFPTLSYSDWADGRDNVNVSLSAVKFRHALAQFVQCNEGLLSYDFDAVKHSLVNFDFDQAVLRAEARKRLTQVAAWVVADPNVEVVLVEGHTDSKGTRAYNSELSRRRAEAVREFFVGQGVASERLNTRYQGERRPVASNRSESGRAQNRRVTVELVR